MQHLSVFVADVLVDNLFCQLFRVFFLFNDEIMVNRFLFLCHEKEIQIKKNHIRLRFLSVSRFFSASFATIA